MEQEPYESPPDEVLLSGKDVNPHYGQPEKVDVQFVLYQNQLWINRRSLLIYLDNEVAAIRRNHIPGINEYWDDSKIRYLLFIREQFAKLMPDPEKRLEDRDEQ